jgi:hypothetical protein
LGLSITKKLVRAMNGNIKVQSIENKGSTFLLCFDKIEIESLEAEKPLANPNNWGLHETTRIGFGHSFSITAFNKFRK